jgi:hypothetical protein
MPLPDDLFDSWIAEAYASAPSDDPVIGTLEFRHSAFRDEANVNIAARVAANGEDFQARLEAGAPMQGGQIVTFTGVAVETKLPEQGFSGAAEAEVSIDNAARTLMPWLDQANDATDPLEPIACTYREFVKSRAAIGPSFTITGLTARRLLITGARATATLGFYDLVNAVFPRLTYTAARFRGLAQ